VYCSDHANRALWTVCCKQLGSKTLHVVIVNSYWKELGLVRNHLLWHKCWKKNPHFMQDFFIYVMLRNLQCCFSCSGVEVLTNHGYIVFPFFCIRTNLISSIDVRLVKFVL
jgi:hypothetical protein